MNWYNLWRDPYYFRFDSSPWGKCRGNCIFCDDGSVLWNPIFLHATRTPPTLQGKCYKLPSLYGILHFQFVNWENLLIKQAWYRCLEHIRNPQKSIQDINQIYGMSKDELNLHTHKVYKEWYNGYDFFDKSIFSQSEGWRKKQILSWFNEYGEDFFKDLDIWDINWNF